MKIGAAFAALFALVVSVLAIAGPPASAAPAGAGDIVDWVATGNGNVSAAGIAHDASGNTFITGFFTGSVTFGSTTLTSAGGNDVFIGKLDVNGIGLWVRSAGGSGDDYGLAADVDASGNLYISGRFEGTATGFGSSPLISNGEFDTFVAKYDTNGNPSWARGIGGANSEFGYSVSIDAAGNAHTAGTFAGSMTVGSTTLTAVGQRDFYVVKLGPTGNVQWARSFGGPGNEFSGSTTVHDDGSVFISASFEGTIAIGSSLLTSNGTLDGFVAKLDAAGNFAWATQLSGTDRVDVLQLATNGSGDVHALGAFESSVTAGGSTLTSNGGFDVYVAQMDDDTGVVNWATSIGNAETELSRAIAVDSAGSIYTGTSFTGTLNFGSTSLNSGASAASYLAKYDQNGNLTAATASSGSGTVSTFILGIDPGDKVAIAGVINGSVTFGPVSVPAPSEAAFVARYSQINQVTAMCDGKAVTINMQTGAAGTGTAGNDVILGTAGADTINGGGGDDTICGEGGNDTITGGPGRDFIYGGQGDDNMSGGADNDRIRGQQGIDTINGNAGNDFLYGGVGGDTINGGDGRDTIGGFGGADIIDAGPGNDTVFGGFGGDTINGGDGNDKVFGLVGNDIINGNAGNDILNGDTGQDTINGNAGDDTLNGGNSLDTLNGNAGNDILNGGKSDDTLSGGPGNDTCTGNNQTVADTADNTCEQTFGIP